MSRSRRKTPITGTTTAASDKPYKADEHQRERAAVKQALHVHADDTAVPASKQFGDPWKAPKDGKQFFAAATDRDLRK